ncbi:hypothetical protein GF360_01250 [candidate division WWE3 bacterium]|nr:hypothetical protein [candidate division WWE3 bacterium]
MNFIMTNGKLNKPSFAKPGELPVENPRPLKEIYSEENINKALGCINRAAEIRKRYRLKKRKEFLERLYADYKKSL